MEVESEAIVAPKEEAKLVVEEAKPEEPARDHTQISSATGA